MIGVPVVTVERTIVPPPKTCCSAVTPPSAVTSIASVISPEPVLSASRPAISLPSALEATSTAAGELSADQLREHLGLRRDEVRRHLGVLGDVDLGGAVLGQGLLRGVEAAADEHRGRLAQPGGQGQQLSGDLLDLAVGVLDENQNLSHVFCQPFSDELLGREELDELVGPVAALVLDDRARLARAARTRTS